MGRLGGLSWGVFVEAGEGAAHADWERQQKALNGGLNNWYLDNQKRLKIFAQGVICSGQSFGSMELNTL